MAGLRNGGIDTSKWYLPGYAGVELLVGDPRFYDPDTLFGGNLPTGPAPTVYPFDARFSNLAAFDGVGTEQTLSEQTWSPDPHYLYTHPNRALFPITGLSAGVSTPYTLPHYSAANVLDGLLHLSQINYEGIPRLPLDTAQWTRSGLTVVDSGVLGVPGNWASYQRVTATAGTGLATIAAANSFTGQTAGNLHAIQCIVRKPMGSTASQVFIGVYDLSDGIAASATGVYLDIDTGVVTQQNLVGTVVVGRARELSEGWFLQCGMYWNSAATDLRFLVAMAKSNALSATWSGAEVIDLDWVASNDDQSCMPSVLTVGTFSIGGPEATSFLSLVPTTPLNVVSASGFTFYVDFEIDSHVYSTDATERSTPFRLTGTAGTVRISQVPNTRLYKAQYFNSVSTLQAEITWSPAEGVRQRVVLRCNNNDFSLHINGVVTGTDVSGTISTGTFGSAVGSGWNQTVQPTLVMYRMSAGPLISGAEATAASSTGW